MYIKQYCSNVFRICYWVVLVLYKHQDDLVYLSCGIWWTHISIIHGFHSCQWMYLELNTGQALYILPLWYDNLCGCASFRCRLSILIKFYQINYLVVTLMCLLWNKQRSVWILQSACYWFVLTISIEKLSCSWCRNIKCAVYCMKKIPRKLEFSC